MNAFLGLTDFDPDRITEGIPASTQLDRAFSERSFDASRCLRAEGETVAAHNRFFSCCSACSKPSKYSLWVFCLTASHSLSGSEG